MMRMRLALFLLAAFPILAQQTPPPLPPIKSPEVVSDGRVTFRFRAPNAKEVLVSREGAQRTPMQRDDQGVWSVTVGPLDPNFYGYGFVTDGVGLGDANHPPI